MERMFSKRCALFLDLDGTLIDIAPKPDSVVVPDELIPLLEELTRELGGAVAIVTGRQIAEIDRLLAPLTPVAAGIHGAEFRTAANGVIELRAEPVTVDVIEAVYDLAATEPGVIVEVKRVSVAIHQRLATAASARRISTALQKILDRGPDHLIMCQGRKVIEIVPKHVSKGDALTALMREPPFEGRRPIMVGDDVADKSAFEAAAALGGLGLKVAGEQFGREEAAFAGTAEVRAWLASLVKRFASS